MRKRCGAQIALLVGLWVGISAELGCSADATMTDPPVTDPPSSFGSLELKTSTAGREPDADGYLLDIGHGLTIGVNDTVTIEVPARDLEIELTALAPACAVRGANPRVIRVPAGGTASVTFEVICQTSLVDQIAFSSQWWFFPFDIYVMNTDGSHLVNLTNTPGVSEYNPAVSPDGRRILFVNERDGNDEIYIMNANGSGLANLTNHPASDHDPNWSPDGTRIAFVRGADLFIMNADRSSLTNLTNTPALRETNPAWSPDGRRIAFDAGDIGDLWISYSDVFVMNADGSNVVRLTDPEPPAWGGFGPAWSPDGRKIAFTSVPDSSGGLDVWLMDADGSNPVNLTNGPPWPSLGPSWSPDGSRIAFSTGGFTAGDVEVFVMNADGSSPITVSNRPEFQDYVGSPQAWSPQHPGSSSATRSPRQIRLLQQGLNRRYHGRPQ